MHEGTDMMEKACLKTMLRADGEFNWKVSLKKI